MSSASSFWARVDRSGDCWNWTGPVDSRGYGHLKWGERICRAHRLSYSLTYGPIPKGEGHHGIIVMHECDNKLCCNPSHLRLGTHADNMADMKAKGRRKNIGACEKNGRAVLTWETVNLIRSDPRSAAKAAAAFGVHKSQVKRIRAGKQWKLPAGSSSPQP